ncbi:hypothetical protein BP6252_14040 [Coleophoma cylindrospora]|uniref:Uncharacterized protein n=1 Tax=Coleophoma cylindrospora TaxID=1849047 RepID=A0A3D8Q4X6_9HELO|nr:hypothetical protein BP6252_14040 [Coleophoma cylindrospora]
MELMEVRPASAHSGVVEWPKVPNSAVKCDKAGKPADLNHRDVSSMLQTPSCEQEGVQDNWSLPGAEATGSASENVQSQLLNPPYIPATPHADEAGKPPGTKNWVEVPTTEQITSTDLSPPLQESVFNNRPPVAQMPTVVESNTTAGGLGITGPVVGIPKPHAELPKAHAAVSKLKEEALQRARLNLGRLTSKPSWPEPQLSLGRQCCRVGHNQCWHATGPALALFTKVNKNIAKLLDTLIADIEDGQPVADNPLAYRMFMIGKSKSTARPTILFISQSQTSRKRAIKYVKSSKILKPHPEIVLANSTVYPMAVGKGPVVLFSTVKRMAIKITFPALALGVGGAYYLQHRRENVYVFRRLDEQPSPYPLGGLYNPGSAKATAKPKAAQAAPMLPYVSSSSGTNKEMPSAGNTTGLQDIQRVIYNILTTKFRHLNTLPDEHSAHLLQKPYGSELQGKSIICPSTGRRSRVGGLVYSSKGIYYGLTAPHVFLDNPGSDSNTSSDIQDTNSDFEFDDEDDEDYDEDLASSEVAATSLASVSSFTSLSPTATAKSSSPSIGEGNIPPQKAPTILQEVQLSFRTAQSEPPIPVQNPAQSSFHGTDLQLDWALIGPIQSEISHALYSGDFTSQDVHRISRPVRQMPRTETQVILSVGNGPSVKGTLWPGVTMMRLSNGSKFVQLWSISVDTPMGEGDSGTWVLDAMDGSMYGHVVAGVSGSGNAFIVSPQQVVADMERMVGPVEFVHLTRDGLGREID